MKRRVRLHAIVVLSLLPAVVAFGSLTAQAPASGQQPAPPAGQPRFTTNVDIVQLDVSVFDRDGAPVRGLTAEDFVVRENGTPQRIAGVVPVELPPPVVPAAAWMREIAPDVVTNSQETRRLVVILMDDGNTGFDQGESAMVKKVARSIVDELGPADLAAVVFTFLGRTQNFTASRSELLAAIDSYVPRYVAPSPSVPGGGAPASFGAPLGCALRPGGCVVSALHTVGTFLASAPAGRKLVFYVGSSPDVPIKIGGDDLSRVTAMFKALQNANVEVNAFDAAGLQTFASTASDRSLRDATTRVSAARQGRDNLRSLAENTGGRAFADTNAPDRAVATVFRQNSSYYLIGFQSSDPRTDGRFRKIEVTVNRPGISVQARSGYYREKPPEARKGPAPTPIDAALARGVQAADLPIQLNAAVFSTPDRRDAAVVLTVGLRQSHDFSAERITVVAAVFDKDWRQRASRQQTFDIPARPSDYGTLTYDVHSQLVLPPGRYELRVAVDNGGRTGSIIKSFDVPDFSKSGLALSGIMLERQPAVAIKGPALTGISEFVPTSVRAFRPDDTVAMLVRIHQGTRQPLVPVDVRSRIVNALDEVVFEQGSVARPERFSPSRSADERLAVPLARLPPGDYALIVEASAGAHRATQAARFAITADPVPTVR